MSSQWSQQQKDRVLKSNRMSGKMKNSSEWTFQNNPTTLGHKKINRLQNIRIKVWKYKDVECLEI